MKGGQMSEKVISEETAQGQIDKFLDCYDIDPDDMPDNLKAAVISSLKKIKKAIRKGRLEIEITDETVIISQYIDSKKAPKGAPNPIVYKEVTGAAKIGIKDDSTDYGKMYSFLGALSGEGIRLFQNLSGKDLSLAESLGVVFLQV
jgi:hypothetical protein